MSYSEDSKESRLVQEAPGQRLTALDLLEASEITFIRKSEYPHRSNGFHHSERIKAQFREESKVQREYDELQKITIADPMSYMGVYADVTINFKRF